MTTPRWQDSPEWRDARNRFTWREATHSPEIWGEVAVAADRRQLREQIQALQPETVDATGHATIGAPHWLPRGAVLDLLAGDA